MSESRILGLSKKIWLQVAQFVLFVVIAVAAPLFKQQFITGTLVNATLFISTAILGSMAGIMVGMIPSVLALSFGLLPAVLAPMVPFIMLGNALLVLVFQAFYKRNDWLGIITAGVIKSIFLFANSAIVINLLLKKAVAPQVAAMMSWPQLVTALMGGVLALIFLRIVNIKGLR